MSRRIVGPCTLAFIVVAALLSCHSTPPAPNAIERARSFGLELQPAVADGVPVRVIDAASGRPVADALVVAVDEIEFTYTDTGEFDAPRTSADLLREFGTAYVTDEAGATRVALPDVAQFVFAWCGGDFGRVALEVHDRAEHLIAIGPSDLVVEVVDRDGRPQSSVPILLGQCSISPDDTCIEAGITGAGGRCVIAPLDLERSVHRTCGYDNLVMLRALAGGTVIQPLAAPRSEPVRFVLPECGELVVELRDRKERPLSQWLHGSDQMRLIIEAAVIGEPHGPGRSRSGRTEHSIEVPCGDAPIHVEQVEVGMELSFRLIVADEHTISFIECDVESDAIDSEGLVRGPVRAGESVHVLLRLEATEDEEEGGEEETEEPAAAAVAQDATDDEADPAEEPSPFSSIELRTITDGPIPTCTLRALLDGCADPYEHNSCPWIDITGRATMRSVPAGRHSIDILVSGFDPTHQERVLWHLDDVEVGPSQHLRDARLMNIDLRGRLRRTAIEVVDEGGRPLSGRLLLRAAGDDTSTESFDFADGHYDLVTAADDQRRLVVAVDRFRPVELKTPRTQERVVMKSGFPIRLTLDPRAMPLADPHEKLYVGVSERPRCGEEPDEAAEDESVRTFELEAGGSACFEIPEPGDWRVILLVFHPTQDGSIDNEFLTAWEPTIHVEERPDEQLFTVAPTRQMRKVVAEEVDAEDSASSDEDE